MNLAGQRKRSTRDVYSRWAGSNETSCMGLAMLELVSCPIPRRGAVNCGQHSEGIHMQICKKRREAWDFHWEISRMASNRTPSPPTHQKEDRARNAQHVTVGNPASGRHLHTA